MPALLSPRRLLITVCTYNERENLPLLIPEIFAHLPWAEILVVDDNSPDGTGQLAEEIAARDSRVQVQHRTGKLGLGTAILAGFRYAIERNYEFVLNMDADFSHHPRYLPDLLSLMDRCDVAIGSRYVPGGAAVGWPLMRRLMSRSINLYARWLLWLRTYDNSGAYRCYRVSKLKELDLNLVRARGYAFQEEILYRCLRVGCRLEETPIVFEDRQRGTSKISYREVITALWVIFLLGVDNLRRVPVKIDQGSRVP
ncbi:MAG: epsH 1 [Planctomycetaceae bacterium]|nr:epsH 1 [Planctomycetaceae bacterium]